MQAVGDVYTIPQENLDFCATIGQIAREKIAPRSAEIDEQAEYPWDIRKLLAEQDILGLPFPSEYGGTGTGTCPGSRADARRPLGQYPGGDVRKAAGVITRRSGRGIAVLYRLSGRALR